MKIEKILQITLIFITFLTLVLSELLFFQMTAKANTVDLGLKAEAAIILDGETGQVSYMRKTQMKYLVLLQCLK